MKRSATKRTRSVVWSITVLIIFCMQVLVVIIRLVQSMELWLFFDRNQHYWTLLLLYNEIIFCSSSSIVLLCGSNTISLFYIIGMKIRILKLNFHCFSWNEINGVMAIQFQHNLQVCIHCQLDKKIHQRNRYSWFHVCAKKFIWKRHLYASFVELFGFCIPTLNFPFFIL